MVTESNILFLKLENIFFVQLHVLPTCYKYQM